MLQFITHTVPGTGYAEGAALALRGGCRWIQLRMKECPTEEILKCGRQVAALCRRYGARLIIDDHVGLVAALGADGVHLGREDMPVARARAILGPSACIGATANTADDIRHAVRAGADYIGLGPLRHTDTKKRLSPVLGHEGYRRIMAELRSEGIRIPVVAIGGIIPEDIPLLREAGVAGAAVSGHILRATDPVAETARLMELLGPDV